jgi:SAM-dependent methyltransferase
LIAKTVYDNHPEAQIILDVGYAQNPSTNLKGEVYGVDICTDHKPENYKEVHNVDLNECKLPFADNFFDAVSMGCVLAHVTNPFELMVELNRVLKDDGVLVLSSPNPNYYWENFLNIFFHYFKKRVSRSKFVVHFYEFSRYNMRTIANRSGFGVVDEIGFSFRVMKLGWKFQPINYPGIAYEIIYVLKKEGQPEYYTICELDGKAARIPTKPDERT